MKADVVASAAVDEVVAVAADQHVVAGAAEDRVVAGPTVHGQSNHVRGQSSTALTVSLPPSVLTTSESLAPFGAVRPTRRLAGRRPRSWYPRR